VAIRTDITQRKADAISLQQYAQQLAEKNKELETIVYTVSHDLRSPLVNIQGFGKRLVRACEMLQTGLGTAGSGQAAPIPSVKEALESTIPQSLRFINAGVAKMEALLAGLLRYSRLGRESLAIERLDMNALLAETLAAMKFQLDSVKAGVRTEPLPECLGDRGQVSQVLSNLLDNALKYRRPDFGLRIVVRGRKENGAAIYSVEDNGIGIVQEHQGKIFEIFHRLNPEGTPGEGLGLTIAQRTLERQRGKIWVESDGARGSTFYVSLPADQPPTESGP
jgi:signal transduction histidine kinase